MEELKRKNPESKVGKDEDSLLFNAELAAGAILSVLKDSDLGRSKALPVDEALALSLQGGCFGKPLFLLVSVFELIPRWMLTSCLMCK